ncbi:NAD-dependent epimerase/dehydratase family protein [Jannaschia pohangensis]|uniref:NAD-dependent epimerase/dehydratase family protein n=1 Tax=Jannaschia pohangensis TaxID=390807 RepID=UPI002481C230|nr:NAD-dependent epimerase/dehydratase family protein [Jannaschia pohangensis]
MGASGFVGRHLVAHLAGQGIAVRAVSRSGEPTFDHPLIEYVKGDMLDVSSLDAMLAGVKSCVQLSTTTKPGSSNADIPFDITSNVVGNVRLLERLADCDEMKLVFISSGGAVYGDPVYWPLDEKHPTNPKSSYGITKLAIEKYIAMFANLNKLDATVLRVSNPFGEHQSFSDGQGVISNFLWRGLNGTQVEIWGDGSAVRDYLYIGDVCEAVLAALRYRGSTPVFNIGFGKGMTVKEIVATVAEVTGSPLQTRFLPGRPTDVSVNVLDCRLAQKELNWKARTPFVDGMRRTAEWMASVKNGKNNGPF